MSKGRKRVDEEVLREEKESERTTTRATTTARLGGDFSLTQDGRNERVRFFFAVLRAAAKREADPTNWSRLNDEPQHSPARGKSLRRRLARREV